MSNSLLPLIVTRLWRGRDLALAAGGGEEVGTWYLSDGSVVVSTTWCRSGGRGGKGLERRGGFRENKTAGVFLSVRPETVLTSNAAQTFARLN